MRVQDSFPWVSLSNNKGTHPCSSGPVTARPAPCAGDKPRQEMAPGRAPPGLSECAACRRPTPSVRHPRPVARAALAPSSRGLFPGARPAPSSGLPPAARLRPAGKYRSRYRGRGALRAELLFTPPAPMLRPGDARLVCRLFLLRVCSGGLPHAQSAQRPSLSLQPAACFA